MWVWTVIIWQDTYGTCSRLVNTVMELRVP